MCPSKLYMPGGYSLASHSRHQSFINISETAETALIRSTDAILTGMDKQELSAMVLLDMSEAFDIINYVILLKKLVWLKKSSGSTAT